MDAKRGFLNLMAILNRNIPNGQKEQQRKLTSLAGARWIIGLFVRRVFQSEVEVAECRLRTEPKRRRCGFLIRGGPNPTPVLRG
jgi:hypothetical protein